MSTLKIIAYYNNIEIGICNYTYLNPLAYTSARQFTFKKFQLTTPCTIDNSGHSYINVSVYIVNNYGVTVQLNKFKIVPLHEVEFTIDGDTEVYGTIVPDWFTEEYNQPLIDAFYEWEEGITENTYPDSIIKNERLSAKRLFSGLPKSLVKGDVIIEGELINDDLDFYELLAKKLIGEKGYIGKCYNSFYDCLIESYDQENGTHVIFKRKDNISKALGENEFFDIIGLLKKHMIKVTLE